MTSIQPLAEQFAANRTHLLNVAYRILGSRTEADDAVQEAWLRLSRAQAAEIDNVTAWLTTVVARLCLDLLRARKARAESLSPAAGNDPVSEASIERDLEVADSVGVALLVVLEALAPAERVCFVLHDLFSLPFEDIAPIVKRSPAAARQLASRARRRVQGSPEPDADLARRRELVSAFLAASREGDFGALLAMLDPDAMVRADDAAIAVNAARRDPNAPRLVAQTRGAAAVAEIFKGRARIAQVASIDGAPGLVIAPDDHVRVAFEFVIDHGRIVEIDLIADPQVIDGLQISFPA